MEFNMLSEYLLGDADYGGGPSGKAGCGCLILLAVGVGTILACKCGWCVFALLFSNIFT